MLWYICFRFVNVTSSRLLPESEQIAELRRELHWAQLKIQVLEEKLRLQRIKKQKKIDYVKMGRLTKFDIRVIDKYIENHNVEAVN